MVFGHNLFGSLRPPETLRRNSTVSVYTILLGLFTACYGLCSGEPPVARPIRLTRLTGNQELHVTVMSKGCFHEITNTFTFSRSNNGFTVVLHEAGISSASVTNVLLPSEPERIDSHIARIENTPTGIVHNAANRSMTLLVSTTKVSLWLELRDDGRIVAQKEFLKIPDMGGSTNELSLMDLGLRFRKIDRKGTNTPAAATPQERRRKEPAKGPFGT